MSKPLAGPITRLAAWHRENRYCREWVMENSFSGGIRVTLRSGVFRAEFEVTKVEVDAAIDLPGLLLTRIDQAISDLDIDQITARWTCV